MATQRTTDSPPASGEPEPLDIALEDVRRQMCDVSDRLAASIASFAERHSSILAATAEEVSRTRQSLDATFEQLGVTEILEEIESHHRGLYEHIGKELARNLADLCRQDPPTACLAAAREQMIGRTQAVPQIVRLACLRSSRWMTRLLIAVRLVWPVRTISIPFGEIVRNHLDQRVLKSFPQWLAEAHLREEGEVRRSQELWPVIRYNLSSAAAGVEDGQRRGDPVGAVISKNRSMAIGGLERMESEISRIAAEEWAYWNGLARRMDDAVGEALRLTERDARAAIYWKERALFKARSWSTASRNTARATGARLWAFRRQILPGARRAAERSWALLLPVRAALGTVPVGREVFREVADTAVIAEDTIRAAGLPAIYRRLFSFEPLLDDELLEGREEELNTVARAISRWKAGRGASVAILGQRGAGKTSLINCICRRMLPDACVVHDTLQGKILEPGKLVEYFANFFRVSPAPDSLDELSRAVASAPPRVAVLEGAHNLFLRRIGGFEALQQFFLLLLRTNSRVLWLLAMEEAAWHYLRRTWRVDQYFLYRIDCGFVTVAELENVILARHRLSAFRLHFTTDELVRRRLRRPLRKLGNNEAAVQSLLREDFFKRLHEATEGNIFVAIYHWLRSISEGRTSDELHVAPFYPQNFAVLETMAPEHYFTLAAILEHGQLTVGELASVFAVSDAEAKLRIEYLLDSNIIMIRGRLPDGNSYYGMNPLMLSPVDRALKRRHILY